MTDGIKINVLFVYWPQDSTLKSLMFKTPDMAQFLCQCPWDFSLELSLSLEWNLHKYGTMIFRDAKNIDGIAESSPKNRIYCLMRNVTEFANFLG